MVRLFILAGQSNMVGKGVAAELRKQGYTAPANVQLFENGEWRELLWRDHFGPEIGVAEILSTSSCDDRIVLLKVAKSGANLFYDWNPDAVSGGAEDKYRGPLYPELRDALDHLLDAPSMSDGGVRCSGFFWMQGERDSVFEFMADAYAQNLSAFIGTVRRDAKDAKLPFVLGRIAPRVYAEDSEQLRHPFREVVQEAQQSVACTESHVALVETLDLPQSDNLHFDTSGQCELGRRFARAYLQLAEDG